MQLLPRLTITLLLAAASAAPLTAGATPAATDAPAGLVQQKSAHSFAPTVERARAAVAARGLTLMAEVDHAANARNAGLTLGPTTLLIFGNPKAGTQLMAAQQTAGIDLPMKLLVWQADDGAVWVGHNDPAWITGRHEITGKEALVSKMQGALAAIAAEAAE